jgi:hypothetical protein
MQCENAAFVFPIVSNGAPTPGVSKVDKPSNDQIKVSMILLSGFFDKEESDVTCTREAVLKVEEAIAGCRVSVGVPKAMEDVVEEDVETYIVRLKLFNKKISGAAERGVSKMVVGVFGVMAMFMW